MENAVKINFIKLPKVLGIGLITMFLGSHHLFAEDVSAPAPNNPYIRLYNLRIKQAELNVKRSDAMVTIATRRMDRVKSAKNSVSREEYDVAVSELEVASADQVLTKRKVEESKAYLLIVDALLKRRVSIPLCISELE